ncbi:hypothetical protein [Brevundimonas goettingensis]|uniref:Uncharacterized protein n=1 Tax=Brevundimonas goettingensis TaxID=2774190 RepID=A0A975C320_9CAUL|nr:hypothetical protein [Brevundimonas goettingensis]QTC90945.1 hypothetical protein IFJ75_17235 [Brevundimonas goettingensis]
MVTLLVALVLQSTPPLTAPADCSLSEADRVANRALTFEQFDQYRSTLRSTAWNLSMAGCHAASAEVDQDYLVHGPILSDRQYVVVRWHMALSLARAGREAEAIPLAAASIAPVEPSEDQFDWNTYVRGVWGFLSKRREVLEASLTTLKAAPGGRNAINARALGRLSKCFDSPYAEAIEAETCAVD